MCLAAMTIIFSTRLAVPMHPGCGEPLPRHLRFQAILRFRKTCAKVKQFSISNSNQELGADPEFDASGSLTRRSSPQRGAK